MAKTTLGSSLKAATAALTTFAATYAASIQDGHVNQSEWVTIAVATILATLAVYQVPNLPTQPDAEHDVTLLLSTIQDLKERLDRAQRDATPAPAPSVSQVVVVADPSADESDTDEVEPAAAPMAAPAPRPYSAFDDDYQAPATYHAPLI